MKKIGFKGMLLLSSIALAVVSGCSSTKQTASPSPTGTAGSPTSAAASQTPKPSSQELKPVELSWYYPIGKLQPDQQRINDEVNKYIKDKINATIKLMPIAIGDYAQKMNTVTAAAEAVDIIWTGYLFPVEANARKGSLLPLNDLLDQYAPNLKKDVPKVFWDGLTVDGKVYAIPNQQTISNRWGLVVQKRFADKYKLDVNSIKKMEDIEPFLEQIKKNEPDIIPYGNFQAQYYPINNMLWDIPGTLGFHIKQGDSNYELVAYSDEYLMNYKLASKWYKAGYIYKDAATAKEVDFLAKGQIAVRGTNTLKPGVEAEAKVSNGGNDVITIPLSDFFTNGYSPVTNQSISKTAKNPERALMFLDLVNTDKYLYNLLTSGVEGVDYDKISTTVIKSKPDAKYAPGMDWIFGSVFNSYLKEGQPSNVWDETKRINQSAKLNPIGSFKFNGESVVTEKANMDAIWTEYNKGLGTGTLDFDKTWPTVLERLNKAGLDKYVAEMKKQLEAYLKETGLKK